MAGHSKWSNIKRKKEIADAQRGAIFTKLGREIQVAVRDGGPDPEANSRLKDVIAKAKAANMPNDNIQRSIQRAAGVGEGDHYDEILYEGYGPAGVAVMVRTLTDNRNRTAGDVRHLFDRYGGNMGTAGCVAFQFHEKGSILVEKNEDLDEEQVMMDALEAGAEDFEEEEEVYLITTAAEAYYEVNAALEAKGYTPADATLGPVPTTWVESVDAETAIKLEKMIDALEAHDDVQDVFHNWAN